MLKKRNETMKCAFQLLIMRLVLFLVVYSNIKMKEWICIIIIFIKVSILYSFIKSVKSCYLKIIFLCCSFYLLVIFVYNICKISILPDAIYYAVCLWLFTMGICLRRYYLFMHMLERKYPWIYSKYYEFDVGKGDLKLKYLDTELEHILSTHPSEETIHIIERMQSIYVVMLLWFETIISGICGSLLLEVYLFLK